MFAFSNMLFSEAITKLLQGEKRIEVIHVLEANTQFMIKDWEKLRPDVIITDMTCLYNSFASISTDDAKLPFILVDTNCGIENIVTSILKKEVRGVLLGDTTFRQMLKAISAVADGDIWIDKKIVKNLIYGLNALGSEKSTQLTKQEKNVVDLIAKGFRNKEIAQRLNISEPTVKTHLYRIFRKLNIKNRSELITFAIKKQVIGGNFL